MIESSFREKKIGEIAREKNENSSYMESRKL